MNEVVLQRALRALLLACPLLCGLAAQAEIWRGQVRDARDATPIADALIVVDGTPRVGSDASGAFHFEAPAGAERLTARAAGYRRLELALPERPAALDLALAPVRPKALYLSAYGIGNAELRGAALALIAQTELNALVIDVKGDRSVVPYRSAALAAAGLTAPPIVADMPALLGELRARGLYLIARIVVFKDDALANRRPQWAVRDAAGQLWRDREQLAWIDPFRREAWALSLALAEEAAQLGFDEVQFDYLRFPDTSGLRFAEPNTEATRVALLAEFLQAARQRLVPYNTALAADLFGYTAWNLDDTQIGQRLETLAPLLDYVSPMLYPSGFAFGIPGHRDPLAAPYEIVAQTLQRAQQRTGLPAARWRPWLQAFRDYAFDRREFGATQIRAQIDAAEALGCNGWMLWNPHNRYAAAGLAGEPATQSSSP